MLNELDRRLLTEAGTASNPTVRRRAVAITLAQSGADRDEAIGLLSSGFVRATQPSFHYIPKGRSMAGEEAFNRAYENLARCTSNFREVSNETLIRALNHDPGTLAPLRMILGLTHNEMSWAIGMASDGATATGSTLRKFERDPKPDRMSAKRTEIIKAIANTAIAVMERKILQVPSSARGLFHSKLDKRDTLDGWRTVAVASGGVPYSALLYQRYVGGVWRQVQDAYSETKGDSLLEQPIADLFDANGISYYRSGAGVSGAVLTERKYGLSPGPDFVLPEQAPTVIIESKVAEDGGTARDKAACIKNTSEAARAKGLLPCAVIDGKGWSERPSALAEVVMATEGRTYSLMTLDHLMEIPEVVSAGLGSSI